MPFKLNSEAERLVRAFLSTCDHRPTSTEILQEILRIPVVEQNDGMKREILRIAIDVGWCQFIEKIHGVSVRKLRRIPASFRRWMKGVSK